MVVWAAWVFCKSLFGDCCYLCVWIGLDSLCFCFFLLLVYILNVCVYCSCSWWLGLHWFYSDQIWLWCHIRIFYNMLFHAFPSSVWPSVPQNIASKFLLGCMIMVTPQLCHVSVYNVCHCIENNSDLVPILWVLRFVLLLYLSSQNLMTLIIFYTSKLAYRSFMSKVVILCWLLILFLLRSCATSVEFQVAYVYGSFIS